MDYKKISESLKLAIDAFSAIQNEIEKAVNHSGFIEAASTATTAIDNDKNLTLVEVKAASINFINKNNGNTLEEAQSKFKEKLEVFGVSKISELPEKMFSDFVKSLGD